MKTWKNADLYPLMNEFKCMKSEDELWFCATNYNALCKVNVRNGKLSIEASFEKEDFGVNFLSMQLVRWKDDLLFVPFYTRNIYIYNSKKRVMDIIDGTGTIREGNSFFNAYLTADRCMMFPFTGDFIVVVNMTDRHIEQTIDIGSEFHKITGERYHHFSRSDCYEYNGKLYLAMFENPYIMEMDLQTRKVIFHKTENSLAGFIHLGGTGDKIYLASGNGACILWSISSRAVCNTVKLTQKTDEITRYFYTAMYGKNMYFFKMVPTTEFVRINTETDRYEICNIYQEWQITGKPEEDLLYLIMENGRFYFYSLDRQELVIIGPEAGYIQRIRMKTDGNELEEYADRRIAKELKRGITKSVVYEEKYVWNLDNLISHGLLQSDRPESFFPDRCAGNDIFEKTTGKQQD